MPIGNPRSVVLDATTWERMALLKECAKKLTPKELAETVNEVLTDKELEEFLDKIFS